MAIDLKALSPKELQALIANANAQMHEARVSQVRTVREKIDALLKGAGLTINDVYPTRGGKKAAGKKKKAVRRKKKAGVRKKKARRRRRKAASAAM